METMVSVNEYLNQNGVDTARVYVFRDLGTFALASQRKFLSFPDAYFFNRNGEAVNYPKTAEHCNGQVGSFIEDLREFDSWPSDPAKNMSGLSDLLSPSLNGKPVADITVFITFTTYSGKLNPEKAFEWIKLLEKAKREGISVEYYLVSADFMKGWNIPPYLQKKWGIKS